jgi:hypothetical protein
MIEHNYDAYVNIITDHSIVVYADRIETNTYMVLLQSELTLKERTSLCRTLYHKYVEWHIDMITINKGCFI